MIEIRNLIVDGRMQTLDGLKRLVEVEDDVVVVRTVSSAQEAMPNAIQSEKLRNCLTPRGLPMQHRIVVGHPCSDQHRRVLPRFKANDVTR